MFCRFLLLVLILYYCVIFDSYVSGNEQFFIKSASSSNKMPLINKRNKNSNMDFEKFFLKASKSVPRIGRTETASQQIPYPYVNAEHPIRDRDVKIRYPLWSEIAERFEYDPALFTSPDMLVRLEQELGDDPSVYDWEKVRFKRDLQTKEKKRR